jgi:hypothetical protein
MNEYFLFVITVLIVYRIALMVTTEEGPFEIFTAWRNLNARTWGYDKWANPHWITKGVYCSLCMGFWMSLVGSILLADSFEKFMLYWFSIAGAQAFLTLMGGIPDSEE